MSKPPEKLPTINIRPEVELILCCARTHIAPEGADRIKSLLRENVDWAYLLEMARRHGVAPLLYWNLNMTCPEAVPNAILSQLREHFYSNAQRNLFLTGELLKLLDVFEAHGIPAAPFKGPVLAASVYGNLALRQFGDLDILVHEPDFLRAKDLLISQGYQKESELNDRQEAFIQSDFRQYRMVHEGSKIVVEIHGALTQKYFSCGLDDEHLWGRLEKIYLADKVVHNISPEDLLLFLTEHGSKHFWAGLKWICDVAELIRVHQGIDWEWVMETARALGCRRKLFLGLLLASDLLGTALPKEVMQRLQADPEVKWLATFVYEPLFLGIDERNRVIARLVFSVRVLERLRDKVRYCLFIWNYRGAPNARDREFLPLPSVLAFVYYLIRPIRLIVAYGKWGYLKHPSSKARETGSEFDAPSVSNVKRNQRKGEKNCQR